MGLLSIVLILQLNVEVHSHFVVKPTPNPCSWENAGLYCSDSSSNSTLAVPAVNLSTMTVEDKITLTEEVWVDYFQSYEHFRVFGCVRLSLIDSCISTYMPSKENLPGLCYSFCGLQGNIGLQWISGYYCHCIATRKHDIPDIPILNSNCKDPVHCPNGMLCGYKDSNTIAVYEKVSISGDIKGNGSGCMVVTKKTEYEMSVKTCTDHYQHLCEDLNVAGQNRNLGKTLKKDQWVYSITDCTEIGKRPTTFIGDRTHFVFPNDSGSWWISVVRDLVIQNDSERRTMNGGPLYEGFLKNNTGTIKLEFVSARENSTKKFIACMSGQPSSKHTTCTNKRAKITTTAANSEALTTALISVMAVVLPVGLIAALTAIIIVWRRRREVKVTIKVKASTQNTTDTLNRSNAESHHRYYKHEKETLDEHEENDLGNVSSEYDTTAENNAPLSSVTWNVYDRAIAENNAPLSSVTWNVYDRANFNIGDGTYEVTFSADNPNQSVLADSYDHLRLKKADDGKYDHDDL